MQPALRGGSERLSFQVADSGVGLNPGQIAKIFRPFEQADTSTTRRFGGTGLGLAITQRLARMLGGELCVESTVGEGSTFTITIDPGDVESVERIQDPKAAMAAILGQTLEREQNEQVVALNGRVLLAEDGLDNQRLISLRLSQAGAEVTIADNGRVAYNHAMEAWRQGTPFDCVLMDMQMPELDGYTATSMLREIGYRGPIIALTAHAMATDRDKCINAGCDDYATKPIMVHDLLKLVQNYMGRSLELWGNSIPQAPLPDDDSVTASMANNQPTEEVQTSDGTLGNCTIPEIAAIDAEGPGEPLVSTFADDPDIRELINMFVENLQAQSKKIVQALDNNSLDMIGRITHQLAGSAGGYGFPTVTTAAKTVETNINANADMPTLTGSIIELLRLCNRAQMVDLGDED